MTTLLYTVVWQHMQGVAGLLINSSLQIYQRIFQWKKIRKSVKIWQNYGHEFLVSRSWPTLYNNKDKFHNCKQHELFCCNTTHWSQSLRCAPVMNCKGYVVSRQDTNRNNTKCMLSVRRHYNTTPVTPCSTEHFLKCLLTSHLRLYSRSHKQQENCLYSECTGWCCLNSSAV